MPDYEQHNRNLVSENLRLKKELQQVKAERDALRNAVCADDVYVTGYAEGEKDGMERAAVIARRYGSEVARAIRDANTSKSEDSSQLSNTHHKVP